MPRIYRFADPPRHQPHVHGVSTEQAIDCRSCRVEAVAGWREAVAAWESRGRARLVPARPHPVREAAGWMFGIVGLLSPAWGLWGFVGGGPSPVIWIAVLIASGVIAEGSARVPDDPKPMLTGFALSAYVSEHRAARPERMVGHLLVERSERADRRERERREREQARTDAWRREVAQYDDLPF